MIIFVRSIPVCKVIRDVMFYNINKDSAIYSQYYYDVPVVSLELISFHNKGTSTYCMYFQTILQ